MRICASCGQRVHFRGQSDMWYMGACWSFSPHAANDNFFCPDCAWEFIRASAPANVHMVGAAASNVELATHLAEVALRCKMGVGHEVVAVHIPWSVRAARRWVLRYSKHKNWTRTRRVLDATGVHAILHDLSFAPVACRRALDGLRNDGMVYARSVGQVVYVHCACRLGPSAFIVHEHARRRRRRRGEVVLGEDNARRVSRRISNVQLVLCVRGTAVCSWVVRSSAVCYGVRSRLRTLQQSSGFGTSPRQLGAMATHARHT